MSWDLCWVHHIKMRFSIFTFSVCVRFFCAWSASPPEKWHVHVNIAVCVVGSNWRWNNKYFLISNRIVIHICVFVSMSVSMRPQKKYTRNEKNSRFHFSFSLLISSRSRLFMVRSWEKSEFRSHSLYINILVYGEPSGIILHPKKNNTVINIFVWRRKNRIHWI